jgi:D-threonate/D-erythronate kinase
MPSHWPEGVEVLAVDLDLREASDAVAYAVTFDVLHQLQAAPQTFLKIDSTLRGPVAALISGALDGGGLRLAVVAPAFPEQGRFIRGGRLYIGHQPGVSLLDILGGLRCVVEDAEAPEDLRHVAEAALAHSDWLLVGSAGLARQLAPGGQPAAISPVGDVLVVAGSPTAVTRAQLDGLDALPHVVVMRTRPSETRDSGEAAEALADRVAAWSQHNTPGAVVLTGGATARAVAHRLGATSLRILGELAPGIPFGEIQDGVWHAVPVVTKAGGFGTPHTLLDVLRALGVSSGR